MLATLALSPLVISVFYSEKFAPSVELLRWISLGMLLRVISWPMGFILLAKGERKLFFWGELLFHSTFVGLVWLGVGWYGLKGVGVAFFATYVIYWLAMLVVSRILTGFVPSVPTRNIALFFFPLIAAVFGVWYVLPPPAVFAAGSLATLGALIFSARKLCRLLPPERFPAFLRNWLTVLRLLP
jgi:antigen flippase